MQQFAQLFVALEEATKTTEKVRLMVDYFGSASDEDKLWTIALFSHRRPRGVLNTRQLRELVLEETLLPAWLLEESYQVVGDLAETLSMLLPPPTTPILYSTLTDWMAFLDDLRKMSDDDKKSAMKNAICSLHQHELLVFFKFLTGGFRVGVSQSLMQKALAEYTHLPVATIAHRLMGNWQPANTTYQELLFSGEPIEASSKPYPFYLAHSLDVPLEDLGTYDEWQAEWKWDGIRSQLIVRSGRIFLWSRGEELITDKFPEFEVLKDLGLGDVVIDGELLPFREEKPMPFASLQTRIGRKNLTKRILQEVPVAIFAYDLLEHEGTDIRHLPLATRRQMLEQLVTAVGSPFLNISPKIDFEAWDQLTALKQQARDFAAEGVMLKSKTSAYGIGRKRGDWWKWKVAPLTIDAVLVYAQKGHGKRADIYSDFTFAVWQGSNLVTFAKAYSGLSDAELREVSKFVSKNTLEKFGPVRTVKPELVFELAFEGIQSSTRHKSGVAVRFPRILRWRHDKSPEDANTLSDLNALLALYGQ